jgi:hypothetical protein
MDLVTNEHTLDTKNPNKIPPHRFSADESLLVHAVQRNSADGGTEMLVRDGPSAPWRSWDDPTHDLEVLGVSADGRRSCANGSRRRQVPAGRPHLADGENG